MRIVQACPYGWDVPGGVQIHVRELSRHLRERGHEVVILTPAGTPPADPGVRVVGRPLRVRYQGTVAPVCFSPGSARRVKAALRSLRPDLVHAHEPFAPSTSMLAALSFPGPVIATFHAQAERSRLFDAAAPFLRPVWRRLDARIAVSEAAAAHVRARMGDSIRIVPNGTEVGRFAAASPQPGLPPGRRLLWVGRLDRQKGFPVAIRAFRIVAERLPDLTFVVVGDGKDRDAVGSLRPVIRGRVLMLGAVEHDRLPPYHAAADLFVSPALGQESFGMVLVEAMAAGLPVVASDIAGYREVVRDGVEGLLVPPDAPEAVAAAIRRLLDHPELAARMGRAGRKRAALFSWERVTSLLEEVYGQTLDRRAER